MNPVLLTCAGRTQRGIDYFLAGLPTRAAYLTTSFFLMNLWEELRGGMARVSVFDPG